MAIKKIIFSLPNPTTLTYGAFGGVRFYDEKGNMIDSGLEISDNATSGESENFIATATSAYTTNAYYYVLHPFDTNKLQTGTATDESYWLTDSTETTHVLIVEFKTEVNKISKIEFVPLPDGSYTDRGVDADFTIKAFDGNGNSIHTYTITPITTNNAIQTLTTKELNSIDKILILSSDSKYKAHEYDGTNYKITEIENTTPTESDYINYGADEGKLFDMATNYTQKKYIKQSSTLLGSGNVFEQPIDRVIKKLTIDKVVR